MAHGIGAGEDFPQRVHELTDGFGADAVLITAATESDEVVRQAMQACRKKGRVVLVGDVGLHLQRSDMYEKELDFLISTSYGPGPLRRRLRARGPGLPDRLRPLDGEPEHGGVPAPARRRTASRSRAWGRRRIPVDEADDGVRGAEVERVEAAARAALLPGARGRGDADDAAADARAEAGEDRRRARRRGRVRAGAAPPEPGQAARALRAARA